MRNDRKPVRKSVRLAAYDYSRPGAYYVTVCTRDKEKLFWAKNAVGAAISRPQTDAETALPSALSELGRIAEQAIRNLSAHYPHVSVDKYVIMPNHLHLLISIGEADGGRLVAAPTLSTMVGQMKRWASKEAGKSLWQKSFHEHVVRNHADYLQIWKYIQGNPSKWTEDIYFSE